MVLLGAITCRVRCGWQVIGLLGVVACDVSRPQKSSAENIASSSVTLPVAPAPASSSAPREPSSSIPPSPAPSASSLAFPPWMTGRWVGEATVYAAVVDGYQSYTKREVTLEIAEGSVEGKVARGPQIRGRWSPDYRCVFSAKLKPTEGRWVMTVDSSTCSAAGPHAEILFRIERVGACLAQWNRSKGTFPFEVEQIALRREGCAKP